MGMVKLAKDDLIVERAKKLSTSAWTEVGFIPEDNFGCKIYARNEGGRIDLIAFHSITYGCTRDVTDGVTIDG